MQIFYLQILTPVIFLGINCLNETFGTSLAVIPDSPNNFSLGKNSLLLFNRQNETGGGVTAMMTKMSMEVSKSASSFNGSTNNSGVTVSASGSGRGVEFEEEADEKMDISVFSPLSVVKNCNF